MDKTKLFVKENSYASVFVTILGVVVLYFMFKAGWDVMWVQYMAIFQSVVYAFVVRPIILCKYVPDYAWKDIMLCTWQMIKVSIAPVFIAVSIYEYLPSSSIGIMILNCFIIMVSVCVSSLAFMDKKMRVKLITIIKQRIHKK